MYAVPDAAAEALNVTSPETSEPAEGDSQVNVGFASSACAGVLEINPLRINPNATHSLRDLFIIYATATIPTLQLGDWD
jgi:hypothetical protein